MAVEDLEVDVLEELVEGLDDVLVEVEDHVGHGLGELDFGDAVVLF